MGGLSMISLNANGLRSQVKRKAMFRDLRSLTVDAIFLQESHSTAADQHIWTAEWGGPAFFSHGLSNSRGVCILFPRSSSFHVLSVTTDPDGRYIVVQIRSGEENITLVNLYAPTQSEGQQQVQFIRQVEAVLTNMAIHTLYIGGDLNVQLPFPRDIQHHPDNSTTSRGATATYVHLIQSLLDDFQLEDIWRVKNPTSTRGTFHRKKYSARLDYWFVPTDQVNGKSTIDITPHPLSDHSMLTLRVEISEIKRGPGLWKFNNNLLKDETFLEGMEEQITEALLEPFDTPHLQWEWLKHKIREFSIKYSIEKNRDRKRHVNTLQNRLNYLAQSHDLVDSSDTVFEVESIKRELREIAESKANAAIFRSKTRWSMLGEKPSAYFLGLERRMEKGKTMMTLRDERGRLVSDNKEILSLQKRHFDKIYTEDPNSLDPVNLLPLGQEDIPQVPDIKKVSINRPFTLEELHSALKELNKGKAPGSDGLTPEFYLQFWELIKDSFFSCLEFSLEEGILTEGQRLGVITLLPKKDLDKSIINNWRPITLLNSDVKIISKAIAKRLQFCVRDVVSADQTGFIRGRSILNNLNNIQAVIDHTNDTDGTGALLAVDYAKAFDTVRWDLIFHALKIFGFGDFIITAIKMLFKDIRSCTYNAGFTSDLIFPKRGIRQGCCSSPTLFTLVVELLAIMVRKSQDIHGIDIADDSFRISQYADDSTFFVGDLASVTPLLRLITFFTRFSGLQINLQKSHLLLLGRHLHPPDILEGIKVVDKVKILGVYFKNHTTEDDQYALNYQTPLTKIRHTCQAWTNRNLSLKGKVTLINSLMISLLQYPMSCTPVPRRAVVEYKKLIVDFIWSSKRSKIAYNLLIQDIKHGGLRLADLELRIRTTHISLIKSAWLHPTSPWAIILKAALQQENIHTLLMSKANWSKHLSPRYAMFKEILTSWETVHNFEPDTEEMVRREIIWNHQSILVAKQPVHWQLWHQAGITTIADLWHEQEPRFLSHEELRQTYGIQCSFLDALQVRAAIPVKWKRLLLNPASRNLTPELYIRPPAGGHLKITGSSSRTIYGALVLGKKPPISAQQKWAMIYPHLHQNQGDSWDYVYMAPYKATRETKYQAFQYKVLQRIIPCNRYLANIKVKQDDTCAFCDEVDTIQHFLSDCQNTHHFWTQVCSWLDQNTDLHIDISQQEFLFGVHPTIPGSRKMNFITIMVKFFVHRQKLFHNGDFPLTLFLRELKSRLQMEKQVCFLEGKPDKFRGWERVLTALG